MSNLFNTLVSEKQIIDWADTLDWLFDDNRFSEEHGWNKGYVGAFTKKVKNLKPFKINYSYESNKKLTFPNSKSKEQKVVISKADSEGRDIIRHIRNGIAHGNTICFKDNGVLCIVIRDYKDNEHKKQTAYICFPIHTIIDLFIQYSEVKKSKNHNRKKGRK